MNNKTVSPPSLLNILWNKLWLIVSLAIVFALIGLAYASNQPPIYEAYATVLIDESSSTVLSYESVLANERRAQTYAYVFASDAILSQTFEMLKKRPPTADELESLKHAVDVQAIRGTQLIRVSARETDPDQAKAVVDTLVDTFANRLHTIYNDRNTLTRKQIETQRLKIESQIASMSKEISATTGISQVQVESMLTQLQALQTDLLQQAAKTQLDEARGQLGITQVERATVSNKPVAPNKTILVLVAALLGALIATSVKLILELWKSRRQSTATPLLTRVLSDSKQ